MPRTETENGITWHNPIWGPPVEWAIRVAWRLLWSWHPWFDNCRIGRRSR